MEEKIILKKNPELLDKVLEEDAKLFDIAVKKYKLGKSKLSQEIIHAWLFANKLKLEEK